jgi:hypothetical protein
MAQRRRALSPRAARSHRSQRRPPRCGASSRRAAAKTRMAGWRIARGQCRSSQSTYGTCGRHSVGVSHAPRQRATRHAPLHSAARRPTHSRACSAAPSATPNVLMWLSGRTRSPRPLGFGPLRRGSPAPKSTRQRTLRGALRQALRQTVTSLPSPTSCARPGTQAPRLTRSTICHGCQRVVPAAACRGMHRVCRHTAPQALWLWRTRRSAARCKPMCLRRQRWLLSTPPPQRLRRPMTVRPTVPCHLSRPATQVGTQQRT